MRFARAWVGSFLLCVVGCNVPLLEAAPGDSHWDRQFGVPGVPHYVFALRFNGNNLYAGGYSIVGGIYSHKHQREHLRWNELDSDNR